MLPCYSHSQPTWQWVNDYRAGNSDVATDVASNPSTGNIVTVGNFDGSLAGEFTQNVNNTPSMASPLGNQDGFVAKHDASGNFIWAFKIGSSASDVTITGVDIDTLSDDIYVTGYFDGINVNFAGVTTSSNIQKTSNGSTDDVFLAKYDSDGNLQWVVQGDGSNEDWSNDVDVNDDGVFITGWYRNSLFTITDAFSSTNTLPNGSDNRALFIAGFDFDGAFRWARRADGSDGFNDRGYGITSSDKHVFVVGTIAEQCTFYDIINGNLSVDPFNDGSRTIFIASYNENNGARNWVERIGGNSGCEAHGIHTAGTNVYITGGVDDDGGPVSFPGIGGQNFPGSNEEIFTCSIDTTTQQTNWWVVEDNNSGTDARGENVIVNSSGDVLVTGYFEGTTFFNGGSNNKTTVGSADVFVISYSPAGAFQWVETGGSSGDEFGYGVAFDDFTGVYVAGQYENAATFGSENIPNGSGSNGFTGRLDQCDASFTYSKTTVCKEIDSIATAGITGNGGGYFYEATGNIDVDSTSGQILVDSSSLGTYNVCYVAPNLCQECIAITIDENCSTFGDGPNSPSFEAAFETAVDADSQWVYVVGTITSEIPFPTITGGEMNLGNGDGSYDGFVAKYDFAGNQLWAFNIGGVNSDEVWDVAVGDSGHIYICGHIDGTARVSGHDETVPNLGGGFGGQDIFVASYTSDGKHRWSNRHGGTSNDYGTGIVVNEYGIFQTGVYYGFSTIGGNAQTFNNSYDAYVQRMNLDDGSTDWVAIARSDGDEWISGDFAETRKVDIALHEDTAFVIGYTAGTNLDLIDAQSNSSTLLESDLAQDLFVFAIDSSGTFNWMHLIEDTDPIIKGLGINTDCDGVYICGSAHNGQKFPNGYTVLSAHDDAFIAKLKMSTGLEMWVDEWNSSQNHDDYFSDIYTDGYGNIYVTGRYSSNPYDNGDTTITVVDNDDVIVVKYQNDGTFEWMERGSGTNDDWGIGISGYKNEKLFVCGQYDDDLTLGGNTISSGQPDGIFLMDMILQPKTGPITCCDPISFNVITSNDTICEGMQPDSIHGSVENGGQGNTYLWQESNDNIAFVAASGNNSNKDYAPGNLLDTMYYRRLVISGCSNDTSISSTVEIIVHTNPVATAISDTSLCAGDSLEVFATGGVGYKWSPVGLFACATCDTTMMTTPVDTTIYVEVQNGFGCLDTDTVVILVDTVPVITSTPDTAICSGDSVFIGTTTGLTYNWNPSATLSCSTCDSAWASPALTTKYFVTATNNNGCSAVDSVQVTVNPIPLSGIIDNDTICEGETATLDGFGGPDYAWSTGATSTSISPSPIVTTEYILTITSSTTGCFNIDSADVVVFSNPTADAGPNETICLNETATLTASGGTNYLWSTAETTASISVSPGTTTMYYVTVTNSNNCDDVDSVQVFVNPLPVADAGPHDTICNGGNVNLTASGGTSYNWSTTETTSTINVSPTSTTMYYVTVTDGNSCTNIDSVEVFVHPLPLADAGPNDTICDGENVTLTASGGTDYVWSTSATTASINVSPSSTTMYYVTVTDGNSCTNIDSVEVFVHPLPTADAGPDVDICLGDSAQLNGSGGVSYVWSPSGTLNNNSIQNPKAGPNVNTKYYVTVTDGNGCSDIDSVGVIVNPLPTAEAGVKDTICDGEIATLTATGGSDYLWSTSETTASIDVTPSSTTTYYVTVTDGNSCTDTDSVTVQVDAAPTPPNAGIDESICDTFYTFNGNTPINGTGTWSVLSSNGTVVSPNDPNSDVIAMDDGLNSFIWTISNGVCPDTTDTVFITVDTIPDVSWAFNDDTICQPNSSIDLSLLVTGEGGGTWSSQSAVVIGSNLDVNATSPGTHQIKYVVVNGACSDSLEQTIEIIQEYNSAWNIPDSICQVDGNIDLDTLLDINADAGGNWSGPGVTGSLFDPTGLENSFVTITYVVGVGPCLDSTSHTFYVVGDVDPSWDNSAVDTLCSNEDVINLNTLVIGTSGGVFSGTGTDGAFFNPANLDGTYNITYTVGVGNCMESEVQTFYVIPSPNANAGTDAEVCDNSYIFNATPSVGAGIWTSSGNNTIADSTSPTSSVIANNYGTHTFYWIESNQRCRDTSSINITFWEQPNAADAGNDTTLFFTEQHVLNANAPSAGLGNWSLAGGSGVFQNPDENQTMVSGLETGTNSFIWTIENGICPASSDDVDVVVKELIVPSGFSPNEDLQNDVFQILGVDNVINNRLVIFNRWGQVLKEFSNYANNWDGTNKKGEPLPEDTYFFILEGDNIDNISGYVVLKR